MGSFISTIFGGASSAGATAVPQAAQAKVAERKQKKKAEKVGKRSLLTLQQEESSAIQKQAQDRQKLLRIGASAQIATTSRGVLGQPNVGRRVLSI